MKKYITVVCLGIALQGYAQKTISSAQLAYKNGVFYEVGSSVPFTGVVKVKGQKKIILSETNYTDGKRNGAFKQYYENGQLEEEGFIKDKEYHGVLKRYFPTGLLNREERYVNGKKDGICKEYYTNGKLGLEENYKNDQKDGWSTLYYENGQLKGRVQYKEGREYMYDKFYNENGVIMLEVIQKEGGVFTVKYFDEKGEGVLMRQEEFKKLPADEFGHSENLREGEFKYFDDRGVLKESVHYKDDKLDGKKVEYYSDGTVKSEEYYKEGEPTGVWVMHSEHIKVAKKVDYGSTVKKGE